MADDYDLIILGAGHNGLILQAYLCKAGLKVLAVDRAPVAGGGLTTLEDPRYPGFLHNTHAFFHRAITAMPWYADLELERHGARCTRTRAQRPVVNAGQATLEWWTDFERTAVSFAQFSRRDAETLRRWYEEFAPIVAQIFARSDLAAFARQTNGAPSSAAAHWGGAFLKLAHYLHSNSCSKNSSTPPSKPACCSSTDCARSTSASGASAIISQRSWLSRQKRKCRAAAPRRSLGPSKAPCGRPAVRS